MTEFDEALKRLVSSRRVVFDARLLRLHPAERVKIVHEAPPAGPVDWVCTSPDKPEAAAVVAHQFWSQARAMGAALLGVPVEHVEAVKKENKPHG